MLAQERVSSQGNEPKNAMDKGSAVREMFDKLAARYDITNTVMTGGIDALWRKQAAGSLMLPSDANVLDLCCGTGALTRELAGRVPHGHVTGVDFSPHMLMVARDHKGPANITYMEADVLHLPFASGTFEAATMAFSMRNVTDLGGCLREVARVVKPGGSFVNLEVGKPSNALLRQAFYAYFYGVLPVIGGIVGRDRAAYRYLPQSLVNFPDARALATLFKNNGFPHTRCVALIGGMANLHIGTTEAVASGRSDPAFATSLS
jgi:demethylmenaquinone methyltransferase/2-methoxy-6-polyprenyl-1,4-benzoquinol methylase